MFDQPRQVSIEFIRSARVGADMDQQLGAIEFFRRFLLQGKDFIVQFHTAAIIRLARPGIIGIGSRSSGKIDHFHPCFPAP